MTKRHKHAKKSVKKASKKTQSKSHARTTVKKKLEKDDRKRRPKHLKNSPARRSTTARKTKVVRKTTKVHKRGAPKQLRSHPRPKTRVKNKRLVTNVSKRKKTIGKVKGKIRTRISKETKQTKLRQRERELKKQKEMIEQELENIEVQRIKFAPKISNKNKPKHFTSLQKDHTGNTILDTKLNREREIYTMMLPDGSFDEKINYVLNTDFSFLKKPLAYNKPFLVRGMIVILHSQQNAETNLYDSSSPTIDMEVNLDNIKSFTVERMRLWNENFSTRLEDAGQSYLEGSGEPYNPDYLVSVSYKFIY